MHFFDWKLKQKPRAVQLRLCSFANPPVEAIKSSLEPAHDVSAESINCMIDFLALFLLLCPS